MATDPNCIFCKIASGAIPCFKVYEDDVLLAFLDVSPLMKGHTLVVPKAHFATVMETPAEVLGALHARMPRITRAVLAAVEANACHVLVNNGAEAMQTVKHLHYHILPRREGDAFSIPWHAGTLDRAAGGALAAEIARKVDSQ